MNGNTLNDREKDARAWASACHLSPLVAYIGVPLGHIFAPLLIWLIRRHHSPLMDDQGKEALNFQISLTLYGLGSLLLAGLLGLPLLAAGRVWAALGVPLLIASVVFIMILAILNLIMMVIAAVKVSNGETYRYPVSIRFLS